MVKIKNCGLLVINLGTIVNNNGLLIKGPVRIDCPNPEETLEQILDINCSCGCTLNGIHI